jgi:histidine triad (HIT) family protein
MMCEMARQKLNIIYEDDVVYGMLEPNPAGLGHIILMPKEHFTIIEQVPGMVSNHLFQIANKLSVATFEALGAMGTNIIVTNGVAAGQRSSHFLVNIIPRWEKDGLNFQWKTKQFNEEELSSVELQLRQFANVNEEPHHSVIPEHSHADSQESHPHQEEEDVDDEDYRVRQLDRVP